MTRMLPSPEMTPEMTPENKPVSGVSVLSGISGAYDGPDIQVITKPHPFSNEGLTVEYVPPGATIADIIATSMLDARLAPYIRASIGGHDVLPHFYRLVRPRAGETVMLSIRPQGGGKSPLRVVLTLAVVALAFAAPELVVAHLLGTSVTAAAATSAVLGVSYATATALITGGVLFVGSLLVNAIAPPPKQDLGALSGQDKVSPTLSITGTRNRINPLGVVPRLLGTRRIYPCYAARPYTMVVGKDQYLCMLFDAGPGPLITSDHKIGETPIGEFDDVEMEVLEGRPTDTAPTLYTNAVIEDGYSVAVTKSGGTVGRTTQTGANEAIVDVAFNGLVQFDSKGRRQDRSVEVKVEYRLAGTSDPWVKVNAVDAAPSVAVTEVEAPDGEDYVTWETDVDVAGPISVTLACPTTFNGVTMNSITYQVMVLSPGAAGYFTGFYGLGANVPSNFAGATVQAGQTKTVKLTARGGGKARIRVKRVNHTWSAGGPVGHNSGAVRAVPTPDFSYANTGSGANPVFTDREQTLVRRAAHIRFPAAGQYDIQLTRITDDATDDQIFDELTLTGIKTVRHIQPVSDNVLARNCLIALRIRATGQLNGVIDQFNFVGTSEVPTWNGSSWVAKPTNNQAWLMWEVATNNGGKAEVPASAMDLTAFKAFADRNDAAAPDNNLPTGIHPEVDEPYYQAGHIFDYATTVWDAMQTIAATARARVVRWAGKYTVVWDDMQTVPAQHISPRNSRNFQWKITYPDLPHALRARWRNPEKGDAEDQIMVYADGYNADGSGGLTQATRIDDISMTGYISAGQVWRDCRYHLGVGTLRPENATVEMDIESMAAWPGALVSLAHPVPGIGLAQGRIKTVAVDGNGDCVGLTVDEPVIMESGKTYVVRIRLGTGTSVVGYVVNNPGTQTGLAIYPAIPLATLPEPGDLFFFGEEDIEQEFWIVKTMRPGANESCVLELVPQAPGVYAADQGAIPARAVTVSEVPFYAVPGPVLDLTATESIRYVNDQPLSDVVVACRLAAGDVANGFEIYQYFDKWRLVGLTGDPHYTIQNVVVGEPMTIAVVATSLGGKLPPRSATQVTITPDGKADLPGIINNLTATGQVYGIGLSWNWPTDKPAIKAVNIYRHAADVRASATLYKTLPYPVTDYLDGLGAAGATWYYWARAVDGAGNESDWNATAGVTATSLANTADGVDWANVSGSGKPEDDATAGSKLNKGHATGDLSKWFNDEAAAAPLTNDSHWSFIDEATLAGLTDTGAGEPGAPLSGGGGFKIYDADATTSTNYMFSELIPVDPNKNYRLHIECAQPIGDRRNYLLADFRTKDYVHLNGGSFPGLGWTGGGTYFYWSVANDVFPATWTAYDFTIGPDGDAQIPPDARYLQIGGLFSRDIAGPAVGATTEIYVKNCYAEELADRAYTAAIGADAQAALTAIAAIADDAVLDKSEKPAVVQQYDAILAEQLGIDTQATAMSITTQKTAYDTAVSALTSYLTGLAPAYNDYDNDTAITRATFNTKFGDVYSARQTLLNKIADVAATQADWSGVSGSGKPADNATVGADWNSNLANIPSSDIFNNQLYGDIGIWRRSYSVNTATPAKLANMDATTPLDTVTTAGRVTYQVSAVTKSTSTVTYAVALFSWAGSAWTVTKLREAGTTGNHPEFFIDGDGDPAIRLYSHASIYPVEVTTMLLPGGFAQITSGNVSAFLADAALTTAKLADGAVDNSKLADLAVDAAKLGTGAVTSTKIAAAAVGSAAIANLAVGTAHIADGAILTAKIGDAQITTAKIGDAQVTNAKIGSLAVGSANIADGAITNAKIANAAIDDAKINNLSAGKITAGTLNVDRIAANSIVTAKLNDAAVTTPKIVDYGVNEINAFTNSTTRSLTSGNSPLVLHSFTVVKDVSGSDVLIDVEYACTGATVSVKAFYIELQRYSGGSWVTIGNAWYEYRSSINISGIFRRADTSAPSGSVQYRLRATLTGASVDFNFTSAISLEVKK